MLESDWSESSSSPTAGTIKAARRFSGRLRTGPRRQRLSSALRRDLQLPGPVRAARQLVVADRLVHHARGQCVLRALAAGDRIDDPVAPFRFQLDDDAVAVVADGLVVGEQRARVIRAFMQDVVPEEPRAVAEAEHPENRRTDVDLRCDRVDAARRNVPGRVDDERDVVVLRRQLGAAASLVGMVRDDDEERPVEPGFGARGVDELPDREVGVFHGALAAGARGDVDAPGGVREGAVIRHGHDMREERLAHIMTVSNHRPFAYPPGRIDIPSGTGREGAVKYTDFAIGQFIDAARAKPWFDRTLFVIVADHTHKGRGRTELPPENYHIPLIVYAPGHVAPGRVDTIASQIDVGPTILGMLGFGYRSRFFGHDIL